MVKPVKSVYRTIFSVAIDFLVFFLYIAISWSSLFFLARLCNRSDLQSAKTKKKKREKKLLKFFFLLICWPFNAWTVYPDNDVHL